MSARRPQQQSRPPPDPIERIPGRVCRGLLWLFTDIDDTLTTGGMLPAHSYAALWDLHRSGIRVVPVTGRPAGWCDHIARMWPVAGVVGENGAFAFIYDREERTMRRFHASGDRERAAARKRLDVLRRRVISEVPRAAISADQPYRISDLAVDFREDVEPLSEEEVRRICAIAREEGAECKVSSIHVNCWYGRFDKVAGVRLLLDRVAGRTLEELDESVIFVGDSPNDEPMFKAFPLSVGVANLMRFLGDLEHLPTYVTTRECADGFEEAVSIVLSRRG